MLALALGLLLCLAGANDRFPLVGARGNTFLAAVGAILGALGMNSMRRERRKQMAGKSLSVPSDSHREAA